MIVSGAGSRRFVGGWRSAKAISIWAVCFRMFAVISISFSLKLKIISPPRVFGWMHSLINPLYFLQNKPVAIIAYVLYYGL